MKLFLETIVIAGVMALFAGCGGSNFEWFPETNIAPVANAGANQSVVVGDNVTLDGSASKDENKDKLTYSWSFSSRPTDSTAALSGATTVNPTFTADKAGDYVLSLIVNDGEVNSTAASVTVTASVGNAPPVANAGADQTVAVGSLVTLSGSGTDADGDTLSYSWAFTSKPDGSVASLSSTTAQKPTFTADIAGAYVVSLIVNDGKVSSTSAAATVTATATTSNSAPVANAGTDQTATVGSVVTLNGSGTDADGDTLSYSWAFTSKPDGSTATLSGATTVNPTFTADIAGSFVISLIANDGKVNSAADTVTVTVTASPAANIAPLADAGPDQTVVAGTIVQLDGSSSSDANGDELRYLWSKTAGSCGILSSSTIAKPTFTASSSPGTCVFALQVFDAELGSNVDTVTITVTQGTGSLTVTW